MAAAVAAAGLHPDTDTDPRELEAFAERFKQRRIKLGKTQGKFIFQIPFLYIYVSLYFIYISSVMCFFLLLFVIKCIVA